MLRRPPSAILFLATLFALTQSAKADGIFPGTMAAPREVSIAVRPAIGAVSGKITRLDGTTGIAAAGVKVYQGTSVAGTTTTNATGDYTVGGLSTGTYSVEASSVGYETTSQTGVAVTDGTTTTLNISLAVPINYVYDDLGRLVSVIDKDGNAAVYSYDAVGNLLSISRPGPSQVSIIRFTPGSGLVAATVTIYGTGFSATANENSVSFNGTAASVLSASTNLIVTTVPAGATTGPITVTSPIGSSTSVASFTVASSAPGLPAITGFTPTIGTPGTAVTINGTNFEAIALNNRPAFNIVNSTVTSATTTSIATNAPLAGSGHISVVTPVGKATSSADFFIPPAPYTAADVVVTGRMTIGGTTTVSITTGGKIGLMLFDGVMGQRVFVNLPTFGFNGGSYVNIYNPDGTLLVSKSVSFSGASYVDTVTLPATGTYSIMVAPWGTVTTGSATLTLYDVAPDFAATITPGGSAVTATVTSPGQNIRLVFNGTSGQQVSLRVTDVTIASTNPIYIYNPNGTTLFTTVVGYAGQFIEPQTLPASGTYTILFDPNGNNTGSATFTLYNVVDVSGTITPGGPAQPLTITTPGQNARFTFTGSTGQQVSLNITAVTIAGSTVYINKPDGTTLTSTSFGTSGSFIDSTTLPTTGTYTVFVNPSIYYTGNMTLTLYNAADVTGPITPGGSPVTVNVTSPGQNARLTFNGSVGQKISINVTGVTITSTTTLRIYKPDGASMGSTWAFQSNGTFVDTQTLPVTGTYTIVVDPYYYNTGNATVKLNDCTDVTGTLNPGGSAVTVTIPTQGQSARLTFAGTASQRVSLKMTSVTIFSSYVDFYKPDGAALGSSTLVSNASSAFIDPRTLPVDGTYAIVVDPNNTNTGSMTLTLYDVPADPTGTVTVGGAGVSLTTTVPGQNASLTFTGTSGQQVTVRVTSNTMSTVTVKLLKPDGSTQTSSTSGNAAFNLATQTLSVTGTYTISVDPSGANIGSMVVTVTSP